MTTKTDTQAAFEKWLGARADDPSLPHGLMRDAFCAGVEADRQGRMPSDEEIDKLSHGFALQYQDHVRGFARALLSRYSNGQPASCDCSDKSQCWEPCGDLGHDAEHAKLSSDQPAASAEPDDMPLLDDRATYPASQVRRLIREDRARRAAPVAQAPVAFLCRECGEEGWSTYVVMPHEVPSTGEFLHVEPLYAAPVAAQAQPSGNPGELPVVNQQMTTDTALADTQRAIIEAAERRGYERAIAECGQDREDAARRVTDTRLLGIVRDDLLSPEALVEVQAQVRRLVSAGRHASREAAAKARARLIEVDAEIARLTDAIAQVGISPALAARLKDAEGRREQHAQALAGRLEAETPLNMDRAMALYKQRLLDLDRALSSDVDRARAMLSQILGPVTLESSDTEAWVTIHPDMKKARNLAVSGLDSNCGCGDRLRQFERRYRII